MDRKTPVITSGHAIQYTDGTIAVAFCISGYWFRRLYDTIEEAEKIMEEITGSKKDYSNDK